MRLGRLPGGRYTALTAAEPASPPALRPAHSGFAQRAAHSARCQRTGAGPHPAALRRHRCLRRVCRASHRQQPRLQACLQGWPGVPIVLMEK